MEKTKVYITGIGVVNALGLGCDAFFQNLCLNRCAAANLPEEQLQDFFKKKAVLIPDEKKIHLKKTVTGVPAILCCKLQSRLFPRRK